jgi:hypothetical protein
MLPDLRALEANIDLQHEVGFLRDPINVHDNVDLSLIKEAAQRLN